MVIGSNEAPFQRDAVGQNQGNGTSPQVNLLGTWSLFQREHSNSKYLARKAIPRSVALKQIRLK